jgi:bacterioferritin-associated ferredoxin
MTHLEAVTDDCEGVCAACPAVGSCAERVVCRCLKVTESEIITAIRALELVTVKEVRNATGAGEGCTCCHRELQQYLKVYTPRSVVAKVLVS